MPTQEMPLIACRYFAAMELMVLEGRTYSPMVLEQARAAGWRLRWVEPITPPHPSDFARDQFVKLHLWAMVEFFEIVYMDLDAAFVGPLQGAFTSTTGFPAGCKLWAARDVRAGKWQEGFNMGVAGIRPNASEFDHLHQLMAKDQVKYEHTMSEQGFLNAVYTSQNGKWCELEFEKNANLAVYSQQRAFWDAAAPRIQVVHYTMNKPWECGSEYRPVCSLWDAESASPSSPVTMVSAYYPGPSKHDDGEYADWGRTFLKQPVPLVIFTDKRSSIPGIDERDANLTRVVELGIAEFHTSMSYYSWDKQLEKDPEKAIHNVRLFKIWLEKSELVSRAMQLDVFHSMYYVWVDFGCFRSSAWTSGDWTVHAERFPDNRILLLNPPIRLPTKRVAGTIFGGSVAAWKAWLPHFYDRLQYEVRKGEMFVGDDQIV